MSTHPLSRPRRPDDLVRVRVQAEERFVGPLWGLYFGENNLSEPVSREFAQLAVQRSGSADAYRLLLIVEVNQDTGEPLDEQPETESIEIFHEQPIDLGARREEIDRRKPPIPDRGVPSEPIPRKKRAVVRLPIGPVVPPAAPADHIMEIAPDWSSSISPPRPAPQLAAALLDDEPEATPPAEVKPAEPSRETVTALPVSSAAPAAKGRRAQRFV